MADRVAQDRNLTEDYMINKAEKEEKHDREPEKNGEKPRCTAIILAAGSGEAVFTVKRKATDLVCLACGGGIPDH